MNELYDYLVFYTYPNMPKNEQDLIFKCDAEDEEHAREQCMDAEPDCIITTIHLNSVMPTFIN